LEADVSSNALFYLILSKYDLVRGGTRFITMQLTTTIYSYWCLEIFHCTVAVNGCDQLQRGQMDLFS